MRRNRMRLLASIVLLSIIAASGCTHSGGTDASSAVILATSEAFKNFSGEYENTEYYKKNRPSSIAVLPFQHIKTEEYSIKFDSENPPLIVRRGMYNHFSSLPYKDLEMDVIDKRLANNGILEPEAFKKMVAENPGKLKSILGVDAVIIGDVTHYDRIFVGIYSQVAVGCEVKMIDLESGELLWRAEQVSRAHAGGVSLNPAGLALAAVSALWNMRQSEMLSQTDELFREIVSTVDLPENAAAIRDATPRTSLFTALNADKPVRAGEKAAFRMIGEPGCNAYVDLGDFKTGIKLNPVSPEMKKSLTAEVIASMKKDYEKTGHQLNPELASAVKAEFDKLEVYEGYYSVEPGEQSYGLMPKGYLVSSGGAQGIAIDPVDNVDIDGLPPAAVESLAYEALDSKVKLTWPGITADDLASYQVWKSDTPLSGYVLLSTVEKNEAVLDGLSNFSTAYFKVRAVDKAENNGDFCKQIEAMPLPEAGLYDLPKPGPALSGEISTKILLVAEKNPYTVLSDIEIVKGGVLYIEPGVEILFGQDAGLTVTGGDLLVYGTTAKPVKFSPKAKGSEPGAWKGVVLEGAPKAYLRNVIIDLADTGLTIENSAPTVTGLTVSGSAQAGLSLKSNSKPNITCSVIKNNGGMGAIVIDGEGVTPIIKDTSFEGNDPFQVQSYTALSIDLSGNWWGVAKPSMELFMGDIVWEPALEVKPANCLVK